MTVYVAENINRENEEFQTISDMVESNTGDIMQMTEQIDALNRMTEDMELCCGNREKKDK